MADGAQLLLASREVAMDGGELRKKLEMSGVSVMQATPATWRLLIESGWQGGQPLKILCGGEPMSQGLAHALLARSSSVWNMYGPTETTVWSSVSEIVEPNGPVTIGRPIANTQMYVLDDHTEPCPVAITGELYIGGDGVARGYLNQAGFSAEKFIASPFPGTESGARLYKTGDLARYLSNGDIECLGRIDNQVKIRGFRIELGEIESVLGSHPSVQHAVVAAFADTAGDKNLAAYVVPKRDAALSHKELRTFLKHKLPEYMVPSRFHFLETLPMTPNGKIDRSALPSLSETDAACGHPELPPSDAIESKLVEIWKFVLGIRTVDLKDNFFDLGGHSLQVARLIVQIDRLLGKRLSTAAVFLAPTVEQQAAMIREGLSCAQWSAVLPVQPRGSKLPFFCCGFHAGPILLPLARRLGTEQPVLSIDPTLMEQKFLSGVTTMEGIGASLLSEIGKSSQMGLIILVDFAQADCWHMRSLGS